MIFRACRGRSDAAPVSFWSLTRFHALVGRSQRRAGRAMTYCLGMLLDAGMVLIADTRTNAGVDNFSCYKKLHCLADSPDRQVFAASSGSLSVSQSVRTEEHTSEL